MLFASSTALLFALCGVILDVNGFTITTAQGLIDFSNDVNSGTSYSGTTVYLGSDIDFNSSLSQQFQPIGFTETNYFNGTFDGKGYVISNLTITTPSSSECTGLFGYSGGATIRNVVMDPSCSVNSSASTYDNTYTGGIIGRCFTTNSGCLIENSVNMGSVSFGGSVQSDNLCLGGIAGELGYTSVHFVVIRNCVNYGNIMITGLSDSAWIGGIVGNFYDNHRYGYLQNCANYCSITHSGSTETTLGLGGIVGYTSYVKVENCLSAGKISSTNNPSDNSQGAIVGWIEYSTYIEYCHFTSDVGLNDLNGTKSSNKPKNTTGSSLSPVSLDSTILGNLNTQTLKNDTWSNWFILHLNGGKINNLNQETLIVTQKRFPDPVKQNYAFSSWCKENITECAEKYDPKTTNISEVTGLHAHYQIQRYTITFIFNDGNAPDVRTLNFNEAIVYPENPTREGFIFTGWYPNPEAMPAENIIITAQWNRSTLESESSQKSDDSSMNSKSPESSSSSKSESSSKPENVTEFVEIVFDRKDMEKEDVENFIKKYVSEVKFTILEVENEVEGGTRVIIKFVDVETAQNFVEVIGASSDSCFKVKRMGFISDPINSFSGSFYFSFLTFIFVV